jgi:hypothetical protein
VTTHRCDGCHGIIRGTRRVTLETAIVNHQKSCPSRRATIVDKKEDTDDRK